MPHPSIRLRHLCLFFFVPALFLAFAGAVQAQETLNDQLKKVLTDPEAMKALDKAKDLAPVELFKSQVLPNDVLPFLKPNHWATMAFELRSNAVDYNGSLETSGIHLEGGPLEVVYHRETSMTKGKRVRFTLPVMIPRIPKEIGVLLKRPDTIREDEMWNVPLRLLEPHQMLVMVLTKGSNDGYNQITRMRMNYPLSATHGDPIAIDRQRYYRFVLPDEPDQPQLPTHPMAWTMISHIIWDGMAPETLSIAQQEAMLDWLHWGGQLIVVGSAGPSFEPLKKSFLGPYLPGESSGNNKLLTADDLAAFSRKYHAPAPGINPEDLLEDSQSYPEVWKRFGRRYNPDPSQLRVEKDKPLYLTGLTPKPGATSVAVGSAGSPPIGVEARVGRGRILMIGVNLIDPTLLAWPGYETFLRRVVFRRVEETMPAGLRYAQNGGGFHAPRYDFLNGPSLTWLRYHGRDLGAPTRRVIPEEELETGRMAARPGTPGNIASNPIDYYQVPVAEWLDTAALPSLSKQSLERASGIEIPNSRFVLKVILAYLLCLVPLNWLICRYGLGRREWAWVFVPLLALVFAIVVERAAAYDVGFESTCDEIDLIEMQGDYAHAHINRIGSIYTTGRSKFTISFPDDPTALVLPMGTGRSIRGENLQGSRFQSVPFPALTDYLIQPRSLSMFRAEQMATVSGTVQIVTVAGIRKVVNNAPLELRDAYLIEMRRGGSTFIPLGTIAPNASVDVVAPASLLTKYESPQPAESTVPVEKNPLDPYPFLEMLVKSSEPNGPEDVGELRLVAWSPVLIPGQTIEPTVGRHRGFTLVVSHLRPGVIPNPDSIEYDALAGGPELPPRAIPQPPPVQTNNLRMMRGGMGGAATPPATAPPAGTPPPLPPGLKLPQSAMPVPKSKTTPPTKTDGSIDNETVTTPDPTANDPVEQPQR